MFVDQRAQKDAPVTDPLPDAGALTTGVIHLDHLVEAGRGFITPAPLQQQGEPIRIEGVFGCSAVDRSILEPKAAVAVSPLELAGLDPAIRPTVLVALVVVEV